MNYDELIREYEELVFISAGKHGTIPHCDSNILHTKGSCSYCDNRSDLHEFRQKHGIQYTNEAFDSLRHRHPCPSLTFRGLETIERWGGNIATITDA